jgi:hypothetical protein
MTIFSCKGCEKRYIGCYSECQEYLAQKAAHDAMREAERKQKEISFGITAQRSASVCKATKNSRNKYGLARRTTNG